MESLATDVFSMSLLLLLPDIYGIVYHGTSDYNTYREGRRLSWTQSVYPPTGFQSTFACRTNEGVDIDVDAHIIYVYVYVPLRLLARATYAFPDRETHSAMAYCRGTHRIKLAIVSLNVPRATKSYLKTKEHLRNP